MAQSIPLVASDVGGRRELIEDDINGILFPAGDSTALAEAIVRVAHDAALRERLKKARRNFVKRERTWAAAVDRYHDVYELALNKFHS